MVCQLRASWERPHVWQRTAPQGKAALSRGAALCSRNSVCLLCCLLVLTIGGATEASEDSVCSGEDGDVFAGAGSGARGGEGKKVLVLGSGGLVGRSVVQWLEARNYTVLHVRNRRHLDLRRPGALSVFDGEEVSFCFFLACEVGGAKFIESSARNTQAGIIDSNLRIYQEVLPYLERRGIPFVFTSSYLHGTENSYGVVKRLGEQWVRNLGGLGKTLRLWNVYGAETLGPKSHVLSDWAAQCADGGRARSRTDGREERQFVHVEDTAAALGTAMLLHGRLGLESDVSSGEWVEMRAVGRALEAAAGRAEPCEVSFVETAAAHRERLAPRLEGPLHAAWAPRVSLAEGCARLLREYRQRAFAARAAPRPLAAHDPAANRDA